MLTVEAIDHLVLTVRDVEASARWYVELLGMERVATQTASGETRTSVAFGRNKINLRPTDASAESWLTGSHPTPGSGDLCLLTTMPPEAVAEHVRRHGVAIVSGPVTKSGAQGAICSVYVRDPDGNLIEISSYR